jgi:hypothetical protein
VLPKLDHRREEALVDARRAAAYRRYLALVATAAPALEVRELELLREAADAALFDDADAAEHRASVGVLLGVLLEEERIGPSHSQSLERSLERIALQVPVA